MIFFCSPHSNNNNKKMYPRRFLVPRGSYSDALRSAAVEGLQFSAELSCQVESYILKYEN